MQVPLDCHNVKETFFLGLTGVTGSLFAKISQSEYAKACFIINEIDIAKLNLPPRCVKIIRFSSLAQPEVGAAYVTAGTLFLAGRR